MEIDRTNHNEYRFSSTDQWDEALWRQAEPIYNEGFPEHGRKSDGNGTVADPLDFKTSFISV